MNSMTYYSLLHSKVRESVTYVIHWRRYGQVDCMDDTKHKHVKSRQADTGFDERTEAIGLLHRHANILRRNLMSVLEPRCNVGFARMVQCQNSSPFKPICYSRRRASGACYLIITSDFRLPRFHLSDSFIHIFYVYNYSIS
jgi:hypothetical protein